LLTYGVLFVGAFVAGRRYQRITYPLARYGALVAIILMSTVGVQHLGILEPRALMVKAAILVTYALLAYLLLLSSMIRKRGVDG
jgi:hypothetical protein